MPSPIQADLALNANETTVLLVFGIRRFVHMYEMLMKLFKPGFANNGRG